MTPDTSRALKDYRNAWLHSKIFLSQAHEDADGRFILAEARARKYLDASADAHYNYSAAAAGQFNGPAKSRQELGTEAALCVARCRRGPI